MERGKSQFAWGPRVFYFAKWDTRLYKKVNPITESCAADKQCVRLFATNTGDGACKRRLIKKRRSEQRKHQNN